MNLKYNAGLFLIGTVVVIWVSSAEVTQVSFVVFSNKFVYFFFFFGICKFLLQILGCIVAKISTFIYVFFNYLDELFYVNLHPIVQNC